LKNRGRGREMQLWRGLAGRTQQSWPGVGGPQKNIQKGLINKVKGGGKRRSKQKKKGGEEKGESRQTQKLFNVTIFETQTANG